MKLQNVVLGLGLLLAACNPTEDPIQTSEPEKVAAAAKVEWGLNNTWYEEEHTSTGIYPAECDKPKSDCFDPVNVHGANYNAYQDFLEAVSNQTISAFFTNGAWNEIFPELPNAQLLELQSGNVKICDRGSNSNTQFFMVIPIQASCNVDQVAPENVRFVFQVRL